MPLISFKGSLDYEATKSDEYISEKDDVTERKFKFDLC